jgi:hypothetical protein
MDHDLLIALQALAEPNRLRVAAACAPAPTTVGRLASDLGLPEPAVRRHLERLVSAGLILVIGPDGVHIEIEYRLRVEAIHDVGRRLASIEADDTPVSPTAGSDGSPLPPAEARIVRAFIRDDRLTTIPSHEAKRLVVIRYLRDRCFVEDREYPEREVNQRLALFHPDVATLRRAMVDAGLLVRRASVYRRPV